MALYDVLSPESGSSSAVEGFGSQPPKVEGWFGGILRGVGEVLRSTPHALSERAPRKMIERHEPSFPDLSNEMVLFWRETGPHGELSNWYPCSVWASIGGREYVYDSSEHLLMARKAAHFGDSRSVARLQKKV